MTSYWIGVAAGNHVAVAVAEGFAMFAHGRHAAAKRVQPGDWVAYYSPREGINAGALLRSFTAIGMALEGEVAERQMLPGVTGWYRRMRWLDAAPASIYPLLDRLAFIKDRQHWGMHFRKSLFKVGDEDFALLAEAMGAGKQFRQP
ncbi:MAG: EVE domain-containing protein [Hyphomicrobiales bacterium]|nr:EVE domain-containing protein [Hyphomicrobiales bacterium]